MLLQLVIVVEWREEAAIVVEKWKKLLQSPMCFTMLCDCYHGIEATDWLMFGKGRGDSSRLTNSKYW